MQKMVCTDCEWVGEPPKLIRGSGWIEFVLYLFYILPGIIYSIWRRPNMPVCDACGGRNLVPLSSPVGSRIAKLDEIRTRNLRAAGEPDPNASFS